MTQHYEPLHGDMRPQDPTLDGSGLKFQTLEHGGEYPDTMPQAIKVTDDQGRSCIYVPMKDENGNIVRPVAAGDR